MTSLRRTILGSFVAALGALSAVAVAGCNSDDIFGGDADKQLKLSITERDLTPGRVTVRSGKIEFAVHNDGRRLHQFAIDSPDGIKRSKDIKPGDTGHVTVDLPAGRYKMFDPRGGYRLRGVSGLVIVTSHDKDSRTVTERTVERTVVEQPEVQPPPAEPPPAAEPAPPPVQPAPAPVAPPTVTKTVPAPPPATEPAP